MAYLEKLKNCKSVANLAGVLGYKPATFSYLLYKQQPQHSYYHFQIPKKSGGYRDIFAPNDQLKALQKRLADLLNHCLSEIDGDGVSPAHGFKPSKSIFTNAAHHTCKRYVFNCDLKDFFPALHFGRIKGYFIASNHFQLLPEVAHALANLVCYRSCLPQGAPTSPVVSNLLGRVLDFHLVRVAKKNGLTYTRYADDLTFSTNKKSFPALIAENPETNIWMVGKDLLKIVKQCGFEINPAKTRMQHKFSRQEVTGVVVNKIPSIPIERRRWARTAVHELISRGHFHEPISKSFVGPLPENLPDGSSNRLKGLLSYIYSSHLHNRKTYLISQNLKDRISSASPFKLHSDEFVFRKFLYYAHFQHGKSPLLICEGKTDNIYIKNAISVTTGSYPELHSTATNKALVRFHSHSKLSSRVLNLNGGTSNLINALQLYFEGCESYLKKKPTMPLIVVVDGDNAGNSVIKFVSNKKHGITITLDVFFAPPNVYVIKIPGVNLVIEDLFSKNLLNFKYNGKSFSKNNNFDPATQYGKMTFVNHALPTAKLTDYVGFAPLLANLECAIRHFKTL